MLVTVQMLQNELSQLQISGHTTLGTSKVAVVLPKTVNVSFHDYSEKQVKKTEKPVVVNEEKEIYATRNGTHHAKKNEQANLFFDPLLEIPTLSHQQNVIESNEITDSNESLNDRLKQNNTELADMLKQEPIRDLRKAIGINDRFLFINDLFRGDEAMYERSIKTINSFNIFPEAEYWINRELIVKLGWIQENDVVKHFNQLVKRRFS